VEDALQYSDHEQPKSATWEEMRGNLQTTLD